ncbi:MAG: YqhA family protein [Dysgonamonadaceae bacterium]|nr:YqhA family protein [Dysgonamonadaceae bacterium]MDD4727694.1 YqhA family protein [Dysgonamonadaceae bacterium]
MKKPFNIFRYFSLTAIICSLIGSLLLFYIGAWKTYNAIKIMFFDYIPEGDVGLHFTNNATIYIMKALDSFLIALALFIFAYGVYTLFISNKNNNKNNGVLKWIHIQNLGHLKKILAEVIIIILFVIFLELVIENIHNLEWSFLIIPISVLLLGFGLKILKLDEEEH